MTFGRFLWIAFLGIAGLVGLGMSLCGGVFLIPGFMSGSEGIIPLGFLVVGVLICFGAWRGLRGTPADRANEPPDQHLG